MFTSHDCTVLISGADLRQSYDVSEPSFSLAYAAVERFVRQSYQNNKNKTHLYNKIFIFKKGGCTINMFNGVLSSFFSSFPTRFNWLLKFGPYPSNIDSTSPGLSIDYCSKGRALSVKRFFNSATYSIK